MNNSLIRKAIQTLEYYENGLHRISKAAVRVTNLKVRKKNATTADITIFFGEGERIERHLAIEYDLHRLTENPKPHGRC